MIDDWDDLRVFLALSRAGNLTRAARDLKVSHPTVARRLRSLETAIGARLFERLPDRFVLTPAGEELLADAEAMERAADSIHRRSAGLADTATGTVRLSAGEAMTAFIAAHLPRLRRNLQCIELELVASHTLANLSRREADLLIREQVPEIADLVRRRLGRVRYAIYSSRSGPAPRAADPDSLRRMPWAGFDEEHGYMPGQAWLLELLEGQRPSIRVNNWLILLEVVRTGEALALLPCHLGDPDPELKRIAFPSQEIASEPLLLVHRDLRTLPRVRAVMDALAALFQEERAALEGKSARAAAE